MKSGAVQIKGSAYVLPANEEHVEFCRWLVQEIAGMGGEAAFARAERIDTVPDSEIVALFQRRKERDFQQLAKALDVAERRIESLRPGGTMPGARRLAAHLAKVRKDFDLARRTDFFAAPSGAVLEKRLEQAGTALRTMQTAGKGAAAAAGITRRSVEAYRGKRWLTRKRPFVDRMASAWLIRKFVDPAAVFEFVDEAGTPAAAHDAVVFDVAGAEFTHVGDLCTFEVLVRSFEIKDAALAKVTGIVHDLVLKDDRYHAVEAAGVEEILAGILLTARDDADALARGMAVFEMLYVATRLPAA